MPVLFVRALAVLCILHGGLAVAEPWKKARPGASTERQVLALFGEPTSRRPLGDERVLSYAEEQAPAGTVRADFHVESRTGRLQRIDVFPALAPSRDSVERLFGPACRRTGGARKPCYEVKLSSFNEPYFHSASRGLAVFFARGEVRALSYLPPARGRRALTVEVEPPAGVEDVEPAGASAADPRLTEPARVDTGGVGTGGPETEAPALTPAPAAMAPAAPDSSSDASDSAVASGTAAPSSPDARELRPATMEGPREDGPGAGMAGNAVSGPRPLNEPEDAAFDTPRPDVLTLGGFYFQRAEASLSRRASDDSTATQPNFPALVDVYLDFRPQENLRTYVVGRMFYDPLDRALSTPATRLEKLWLYFGLFERVFVTAGRQHVKWGSSRVWNTTDFLRAPNPDPLGVFDLRPGVDMVKVNVPFESLASNLWFFATAELEDTPDEAPSQIRYGGAVRAEVVLGASEFIATASFLEGRRPRYGLDYSLGLGRFDLNAEVALVRDSDVRRWRRDGDGFAEQPVEGTKVQASGGVAAELRIADIYRTVVRLEGLYNELGGSERELLTWTQSTGDYQPLYFGQLYGMAQVSVTRRSASEPNVSLTVLGNASDPSFVGRLDFGFKVNEALLAGFAEAPFGERGGEFRFQADPSVADLPATDLGLFRVGLSLRLKL